MDFCRNVSVSGGFPSEYPSEQVISPAFSSSLDDLFPIQNTEGDVSMEWLSAFVEDCLSSSGNCIPVEPTIPSSTTQIPRTPKPSSAEQKPLKTSPVLQEFSIPGKARSKRKRSPTANFSHLVKKTQPFHVTTTSDPPLLHQAYWLADSELIVPKKMNSNITGSGDEEEEERVDQEEEEEEEEEILMGEDDKDYYKLGSSNGMETSHGQARRCTHCLSQRTPQWRAGPLGPKTLCNACGVRFKSGRLLPEYRPAKSPTFVSYKHSNSHKKVLEMRMSSVPSTEYDD